MVSSRSTCQQAICLSPTADRLWTCHQAVFWFVHRNEQSSASLASWEMLILSLRTNIQLVDSSSTQSLA